MQATSVVPNGRVAMPQAILHRCTRASDTPKAAMRRYSNTYIPMRKRAIALAASEDSRESPSSIDEESRLEALERGVRRKQGEKL